MGDDGEFGQLGPIDDEDVVGRHAASHVHLFVALQQVFIEGAGGVHLPLQKIVLDAAFLQIEGLFPQGVDPLAHFVFLALRRFVGRLVRSP